MAQDSLFLWLSATKPIGAVAIAQLWEQGVIGLDDAVAQHIPDFAAGDKAGITLRHILTHTGGFRHLRFGWPEEPWESIIDNLCAAKKEPRWEPGHKAGYHMASSWFVLGELVRRLDGRPFSAYVRQEIFEPLGMTNCWVGMPESDFERHQERLVWSFDTATGGLDPHPWHERPQVVGCSPGGNGRGPMAELGRFYEMLLGGGQRDGVRILATPTVEAITARHRVGLFDHTFRCVMDWGLGVIPNSSYLDEPDLPYHYGRAASRRTFGHSGYRSTLACCDPEHQLVVSAGFNGTPSEANHRLRARELMAAIYEDLGLS